jgi:hypothetical protein
MGRIFASVQIENLSDPIGYVILAQSQAAVDMIGHRLIPVKRMDLK